MRPSVDHSVRGQLNMRSKETLNVRGDFPILKQSMNGKPLVYLDNAATTQKPQCVTDRIKAFYETENANIHRGVYLLSDRATEAYEAARVIVQEFINAQKRSEIIFLRGTTEGINLVAQSFGQKFIQSGDQILISAMEHHSNIVPWQMLCQRTGAQLKVIPMNENGELILEAYEKLLNPKVKLVGLVHLSNALGTINPIKGMINQAHQVGAKVIIDGAQAISHLPVDVQDLDCDFYVFSGHKVYGPTGIGALFGKEELLAEMPPFQGGGDMILSVTFEKTTYAKLPNRFEAGTPHIAGAIGLGEALNYLSSIGFDRIVPYEQDLFFKATQALSEIEEVRIIGQAREKASVLSFTLGAIHPHDIGTVFDQEGVAIRAGHHCAQPVMAFFGVPATARASFSFYNTVHEIDCLVEAVHKTLKVFS